MGRIGRSFRLMGQSVHVLMKDKELLVLPLLSSSLALPLLIVCGFLVYAGLTAVGVVLGVLGIALIAIFFSALQAVYVTALYQYATTGAAPEAFDGELIEGAFAPKTSRGRP